MRNASCLVLVLIATAAASRPAAAQVPLCVDVEAPASDLDGLRRLVATELARHASHEVVERDCRTNLRVQLFEAAGVLYLTGQVDREVPVRFEVKDRAELADRLTEGLSLVLHSDPVYLAEDIEHYSEVQRLAHSLGVGGHTLYRVEMFEAIGRSGTNPVFATGAAFAVTRGSGHWQVLARAYLGGWPTRASGTDRTLQLVTGADAGLTYEFLDLATWSPYVSLCAGIQFQRYAGREVAADPGLTYVNQFLVDVSARAGFRFFRANDFDLDVFVQGYLPLHLAKDADGALFGDKGLYTPSLQVGIGVGF